MRKLYSRWREHGTPGWLLVYTLGGMGRFGHPGGELRVKKGDLVLIAPKTRNDYGLEEKLCRWDLLWAYFFPRSDWYTLLRWPEISPGLMYLHLDPQLRGPIVRKFADAHRLNSGPHRHHELFGMNAIEMALLLCDGVNPRSEQSRMDPRILRSMDYLCQNLASTTTLPSLARRCGLSVSRLSHLFREQSGQSPRRFLEVQRIVQARQLLELTQKSVTSIAAETGFPDALYFSRRFKHHTGLSPRHYRKKVLAMSA